MTFSKEKVLTQHVCQNDLNIGILGVCGHVPELKWLCGKQKFCCGNELFIIFSLP